MRDELGQATVCIVGLGYVGLPLAKAFSQHFRVIGYDSDSKRVNELRRHNANERLVITDDPKQISPADFIAVTVPTPVTKTKEPDLSCIISAARTISQNMKAGCTVVLESTVYPGVTEDIVKPILEESGLRCGQDFRVGYSPERINPGDEEHSIDKVAKVVSGMNEETTEALAQLYGRICPIVFKATDIKTAEAAKVIENVQRDLNIALVNELCLIFDRLGLSTKDVLDAAATKWNFHRFSPGLVGGHCIPVDPYYLVYKARELGYHPQVILAGRAINDYMPKHIVQMTVRRLNDAGRVIRDSRVLVMGLTYKENVPDTRETPTRDMIEELRQYGVKLYGYDPLLNNIEEQFGIEAVNNLDDLKDIDCVILTVNHDIFRQVSLSYLKTIMGHNPVLIDVHRFFDETEAKRMGFDYRSL